MKAPDRFAITITGSTRYYRPEEWHQMQYLLGRLLQGEPVAEQEFTHFGLTVTVQDAEARRPLHRTSPETQKGPAAMVTRRA
jgi:hypothetical protein